LREHGQNGFFHCLSLIFRLDLFVAAGANVIEHCVIGALVCRKSDQGRQIRNLSEITHVSAAR
jgi:hypothetical protein